MFRFECGVLAGSFSLVGARWSEGLSQRFRVEVFVAVPAADAFDPEEALWLDGAFHMDGPRGDVPFYGVVGECEEVYSVAHGAGDDSLVGPSGTYYRIVLVPRVERMVETLDSWVWVERGLQEVFGEVLARAGLSKGHEWDATFKDRKPGSQIAQYKESDFDFLSRWMEREGIYYVFRHEDDVDCFTMVDDWGAHDADAGTFRVHGVLGEDATSQESFQRFSERIVLGPKEVSVADRVALPAPTPTQGEACSTLGAARGTWRRFGERALDDGGAGDVARVAIEALDAERRTFTGIGGTVGIRPGMSFSVTGHPLSRLDAQYRATRWSGTWNERFHDPALSDQLRLPRRRFESRVDAIADGQPFRAPQHTAWPRVPGIEVATIDGPGGGDYAQLDGDGQYVVRFRFDGASRAPGGNSIRMRMAQPHAGAPEGWHFPLRKETEVMTTFLHGDPDRPFILGAVTHPLTPSSVTSANSTKNVLGTGGTTRLEIEDQADSQWAWLWTPVQDTYLYWGKPSSPTHHIVAHTDGNAFYNIGSNQDVRVGGKLFEQVTGAVTETYDTSMDTFVDGPQITIVSSDVSETYGGTQTTHTKGAVLELYGGVQETGVTSAGRKETFDGGQLTLVVGAIDETVAGGMKKTVNGPTLQGIAGTMATTVSGGGTTITHQSAVLQNWGPTDATMASLDLKVPGGVVHMGTTVTIDTPGDGWLGTVKTYVIQNEFCMHAIRTERFDAKAEANALAVAVTPLKLEVNDLLGEFLGFGLDFGTDSHAKFAEDLESWALHVRL